MWNKTRLTERLSIQYPIIQGPFGGGFSTSELVAAVSNKGGLGSYGANGLTAEEIVNVIADISSKTSSPFAVNLWVSTEDDDADLVSHEQFEEALRPLAPILQQLGIEAPKAPPVTVHRFEDQVQAILEAAPPVFSFVFGVPPAEVLEECRRLGIITIGTATTVEEGIALDRAGVDAIVATGLEAGGHRVSFLRPAESSLVGTISLVPQVVDEVRAPVIAAGGIADGRGIVAALALGASGVQIGTAFLACQESNASRVHRDALFSERSRQTVLTRAFTGRLARSISSTLSKAYDSQSQPLPYPLQRQLITQLREQTAGEAAGELTPLWAGQSASLLKTRTAAELFCQLVEETSQRFAQRK